MLIDAIPVGDADLTMHRLYEAALATNASGRMGGPALIVGRVEQPLGRTIDLVPVTAAKN